MELHSYFSGATTILRLSIVDAWLRVLVFDPLSWRSRGLSTEGHQIYCLSLLDLDIDHLSPVFCPIFCASWFCVSTLVFLDITSHNKESEGAKCQFPTDPTLQHEYVSKSTIFHYFNSNTSSLWDLYSTEGKRYARIQVYSGILQYCCVLLF